MTANPGGNQPADAGRKGLARKGRALPVIAGLTAALALGGAAVYTVDKAGCPEPGQFIRHDNHIELVGGCVTGTDLPHTDPNANQRPEPGDGASQLGRVVEPDNYRP